MGDYMRRQSQRDSDVVGNVSGLRALASTHSSISMPTPCDSLRNDQCATGILVDTDDKATFREQQAQTIPSMLRPVSDATGGTCLGMTVARTEAVQLAMQGMFEVA